MTTKNDAGELTAYTHNHCDHDEDRADTAACEIDAALAYLSMHLDGATVNDPGLPFISQQVKVLGDAWSRLIATESHVGAAPSAAAPPWRTGRKVGRTIYQGDTLIGLMDTPELAARVVAAVNASAEGAVPETRPELPYTKENGYLAECGCQSCWCRRPVRTVGPCSPCVAGDHVDVPEFGPYRPVTEGSGK